MPISHLSRLAVPALAIVCLLGGCSTAEEKTDQRAGSPQVASLRSPDAPASSRGAPDDERPLVPLDATSEDREALWKVWGDCIMKEGDFDNPKDIFLPENRKDPKTAEVRKTCLPKEPETYEERQKRTDIAAFRDNQREWYKCAQQAGYKLTSADENGEFGITEVGPNGDFGSPTMEACRKEAFSR